MTARRLLVLSLFSLVSTSASLAQGALAAPPPKREVRAVWITTVNGLDWPKSTDRNEQQQSLRQILDRLQQAHFNTIFFQVRGRGDALYRSTYEPWSNILTGSLGQDPGWDPLQFVLDEAHRRGIEVHAWINTFLIKSSRLETPETSPRHIVLSHPEWLHLVDGEYWLDPGIPAVRKYLLSVVLDIARNYQVDGIHFDFIRYPGKPFPDESTFRKYGGSLAKEEWRRENINSFVRTCYEEATKLKPLMKIGSAPIGIYTNFGNVRGLQGYSDLFQDSREWLRMLIHDYLCPQVYWSLGDQHADPDFAAVAGDWMEHAVGRDIYIGIGAYKPEVHGQLPDLIDLSRRLHAGGQSFFRYDNIQDALTLGGRYRFLANIPPMKWKDSIPPNPPRNLQVTNLHDGVFKLEWGAPASAPDGDNAAYYNIYRAARSPVDVSDPANILAITPVPAPLYIDSIAHPRGSKYYYAVSAFDKGNNESTPTAEQVVLMPDIIKLAKQFELQSRLGRHFPEPASSIVYIPYELRAASPVFVKILDQSNREVANVVDAVQEPGSYIAAVDISTLKRGEYSWLFIAGQHSERKPLQIRN